VFQIIFLRIIIGKVRDGYMKELVYRLRIKENKNGGKVAYWYNNISNDIIHLEV